MLDWVFFKKSALKYLNEIQEGEITVWRNNDGTFGCAELVVNNEVLQKMYDSEWISVRGHRVGLTYKGTIARQAIENSFARNLPG